MTGPAAQPRQIRGLLPFLLLAPIVFVALAFLAKFGVVPMGGGMRVVMVFALLICADADRHADLHRARPHGARAFCISLTEVSIRRPWR
jgi:hypothetical protein